MSEHTPGPWEVRESLASGEVVFVRSGTRERIALAKTEADARLIAKGLYPFDKVWQFWHAPDGPEKWPGRGSE